MSCWAYECFLQTSKVYILENFSNFENNVLLNNKSFLEIMIIIELGKC